MNGALLNVNRTLLTFNRALLTVNGAPLDAKGARLDVRSASLPCDATLLIWRNARLHVGNDVLHDEWRELADDEVDDACQYMQRSWSNVPGAAWARTLWWCEFLPW